LSRGAVVISSEVISTINAVAVRKADKPFSLQQTMQAK